MNRDESTDDFRLTLPNPNTFDTWNHSTFDNWHKSNINYHSHLISIDDTNTLSKSSLLNDSENYMTMIKFNEIRPKLQ